MGGEIYAATTVKGCRMGETWTVYRILVRKPLKQCSLGRPRRRQNNNIKTALRESGLGSEVKQMTSVRV